MHSVNLSILRTVEKKEHILDPIPLGVFYCFNSSSFQRVHRCARPRVYRSEVVFLKLSVGRQTVAP